MFLMSALLLIMTLKLYYCPWVKNASCSRAKYIQENRILLTHNCDDFEELHQANPSHSGVLAVYRNANRFKNMDFKAIVNAIANLETANVPLANQFISLNQWNY